MYSVPPNSISRPPDSLLPPRTASTTRLIGDAVGLQPVGVDVHLVLLAEAADGRHLGHARHRLEVVA